MMDLTDQERALLEISYDDSFGLQEFNPSFTITLSPTGVEVSGSTEPTLQSLLAKGLVRLVFAKHDPSDARPIPAEDINDVLANPDNWAGSESPDHEFVEFAITDHGMAVMNAIWTKENEGRES
ncbi:MAG: hypothetical protein WD904_04380 [Dehalococcoidia bacterium]